MTRSRGKGYKTFVIFLAAMSLAWSAWAQTGTAYAWGKDDYGQIGTGVPVQRSLPVQVADSDPFVQLGAGIYWGMGLKADGTVWTWGTNGNGTLGQGFYGGASGTPQAVPGLAEVVSIGAGPLHALAVKADGSLWTWGSRDAYKLGRTCSPLTCYASPGAVSGLPPMTQAAGGHNHSLALSADGTVWAWGSNEYGQLGTGTTGTAQTPVQVPGLTSIVFIAAGGYHSLAIRSDGTLWAWGGNFSNQLGDGTTTTRLSPVQVPGLADVAFVAAGSSHNLAVLENGTLYVWGSGNHGKLGLGDTSGQASPALSPLSNVVSASAGEEHSVVLKADGSVWVFGKNDVGQLGDGTTTDRYSPTECGIQTLTTAASAGRDHTLLLASNGQAWAVGQDQNGQLGSGREPVKWSPVQVAGLGSVVSLAGGGGWSMALREDGTVWAWGENSNGALGNGTRTPSDVPVQIPGLSGVIRIAAARGGGGFALKSDGTVWSWGSRYYGLLGRDGDYLTVGQVENLSDIVFIGAAWWHAFAVKSDGTLWMWGRGYYGALGNGTTDNASYPFQLAGIPPVAMAAGGMDFTAAVLQDGGVYAWGQGDSGQLGDGTSTDHFTPQPANISNVASIAGGYNHVLAIHDDGTVSGWGANDRGQLGDGTTQNRYSPVPVPGLVGATGLAATIQSSLVLQGDGTLWTFGDNTNGELAQPFSVSTGTAPVQVAASVLTIGSGANHGLAVVTCALDLSTSVPSSGVMGQPVAFGSTLNLVGDCTGTPAYLWAFGDGAESTEADPSHTYASAGTYAWTLTVTLGSLTASAGGNFSVAAPPLYADAQADTLTGNVPLTVHFTGSGTGGIAPYTYLWDFGDGGTSTEANPTHLYTTKGDYTVTFTVRDTTNQTATETLAIAATALAPQITSIVKKTGPFRLLVSGSNLQQGVRVFINGIEWTPVTWKSASKIVLKGSTLKTAVPKGTPTVFRFLNPDGGEVFTTWQY
ncbi:MAG: PKD domain-containing protein [Acidobacteriota bacterium]